MSECVVRKWQQTHRDKSESRRPAGWTPEERLYALERYVQERVEMVHDEPAEQRHLAKTADELIFCPT